jgi:nucleotide-binding universal stress UspA family protein
VRDVAVAWDGSRVAARALADVLALLRHDARITVLTVTGEKALDDETAGERLAACLQERGLEARARSVPLQDRPTGLALQEAAIEMEAGLLAMGGFGHSRLRDFVLGGATQGVFSDLRLPVLMSH